MSRRNLGGFIRPGYNPLRVPNAPTIGTATAGDKQVSVTFTAPSCVGGGAITSYTAVANCGTKFASGASSPITVGCLTNCTAYTFKVYANNSYGPSSYSASSNSATPKVVVGQQAYTTAGTYSWVAPTGVTSVSVVAVGGGGGAGGGLGWKNSISVTPGTSYTVVVGAGRPASNCSGGNSYFKDTSTVVGYGGGQQTGGSYVGDGGGNGGSNSSNAGSGAGGYTGPGGNTSSSVNQGGSCGSGGGGGGAGLVYNGNSAYGAGGGVGILGEGANGAGGGATLSTNGGKGGSGGGNGTSSGSYFVSPGVVNGGNYGGGGGRNCSNYGLGGGGAVRIIWPGSTRKFPSTCTGDK